MLNYLSLLIIISLMIEEYFQTNLCVNRDKMNS